MTLFILIASLALILWVYAGYPLWLSAMARLQPRPYRRNLDWYPSVSVILPVRDESKFIDGKLSSLLAQPWPEGMLEILVVDDGSSDDTLERVRRWRDRGVVLLKLDRARGKAVALNRGASEARGEILIFTDARQPLAPACLAELVAPLADASVGAVSGELDLGVAGDGLSMYRRFDDRLRRWEAATGSAIGVTGALWAMRRRLWRPLPEGTILDDLHQPLEVARQGYRVVVEPHANVLDVASPAGADEIRRRVRTLAGNLQLVRALPWALLPGKNPLFSRLLSHKLLRLVAPFALVSLLLTSFLLAQSPLFFGFLVLQLVAYSLATVRPAKDARDPLSLVARLARSFVILHLAVALAWWEFARGRHALLWRPAQIPAGTRVSWQPMSRMQNR